MMPLVDPRERTRRILASLARRGHPFEVRIPLAEDECHWFNVAVDARLLVFEDCPQGCVRLRKWKVHAGAGRGQGHRHPRPAARRGRAAAGLRPVRRATRRSVLLPSRPRADLLAYLHAVGSTRSTQRRRLGARIVSRRPELARVLSSLVHRPDQ